MAWDARATGVPRSTSRAARSGEQGARGGVVGDERVDHRVAQLAVGLAQPVAQAPLEHVPAALGDSLAAHVAVAAVDLDPLRAERAERKARQAPHGLRYVALDLV